MLLGAVIASTAGTDDDLRTVTSAAAVTASEQWLEVEGTTRTIDDGPRALAREQTTSFRGAVDRHTGVGWLEEQTRVGGLTLTDRRIVTAEASYWGPDPIRLPPGMVSDGAWFRADVPAAHATWGLRPWVRHDRDPLLPRGSFWQYASPYVVSAAPLGRDTDGQWYRVRMDFDPDPGEFYGSDDVAVRGGRLTAVRRTYETNHGAVVEEEVRYRAAARSPLLEPPDPAQVVPSRTAWRSEPADFFPIRSFMVTYRDYTAGEQRLLAGDIPGRGECLLVSAFFAVERRSASCKDDLPVVTRGIAVAPPPFGVWGEVGLFQGEEAVRSTLVARTEPSIVLVRVTFVDGTVDEHVPHGGYALLRGPAAPRRWVAFDDAGEVASGEWPPT